LRPVKPRISGAKGLKDDLKEQRHRRHGDPPRSVPEKTRPAVQPPTGMASERAPYTRTGAHCKPLRIRVAWHRQL